MFNRRIMMLPFVAGIAAALAAAPSSIMGGGGLAEDLVPDRHRRHKGKGQNNTRGRGKIAKPKKRSNRLTISKRVRRKHRRAM